MSKVYTGIGSRETPTEVLDVMELIAFKLAKNGWIVRTGGAPGADSAFASGARDFDLGSAEIYLPWEGFEGWGLGDYALSEPQLEAYAIAEQFHPVWYRLGKSGKALHARNVHQVLGFDVTKPELTKFILAWTKNGKEVGGTAQALRIAKHYRIPIYNLGVPWMLDLWRDLL